MRNLLHEEPMAELTGRPLYTTRFVRPEDLKGRLVLNVGCGYGWFELFALSQGVQRITGTEMTDDHLATARESVRDSRAVFQVGSALRLPFEDRSFDTVMAWEVIEHLPEGQEPFLFREVNRVLKAGGVFYLSTPHASWWSNGLDPAWWLIGHRHYTLSQLRRLAEEPGFHVVEVGLRGGWWNLVATLNFYGSKWVFRRRPFFNAWFQRKDDEGYSGSNAGFTNVFMKYSKPAG